MLAVYHWQGAYGVNNNAHKLIESTETSTRMESPETLNGDLRLTFNSPETTG